MWRKSGNTTRLWVTDLRGTDRCCCCSDGVLPECLVRSLDPDGAVRSGEQRRLGSLESLLVVGGDAM
jgi:hypothetical protein